MRLVRKIDVIQDPDLVKKMVWASWAMLIVCLALAIAWFLRGGRHLGILRGIVSITITAFVYPTHEYIHGAFFRLLGPPGTTVTYGFGMGFLFTSANDAILTRNRYLVVTLAPTVIITIASLVLGRVTGHALIGIIVCMLHLFGCVGDIVMAGEIVATSGVTHVRDTGTGAELLAAE